MSARPYQVLLFNDYFFLEDWNLVQGNPAVELIRGPSITHVQDIVPFIKKMAEVDVMIFMVHGGYSFFDFINRFKHIPAFMNIMLSTPQTKKVLWSVDSHKMQNLEGGLASWDIIDTFYSAHSQFMDALPQEKAQWLPCCYRLSNMKDLRDLNNEKIEKSIDVGFFYNVDPTGDRNGLALKAKAICDDLGYTSLFGHVGNWFYMADAIKRSRLNLNLSMSKELNYRTFELLAYNAHMIGDKTVDHDKVNLDYSNTIFIDRHLSDFKEKLKAFMEKEQVEKKTADSVLSEHMLVHRIVTIINRELNTNLKVVDPLLKSV
jgi:hypothetical protein